MELTVSNYMSSNFHGIKVLNTDKTQEKYGYSGIGLKPQSLMRVVYTCNVCNKSDDCEYRNIIFNHRCERYDPESDMYRCNKCGTYKKKDDFHNNKRHKLSYHCKLCDSSNHEHNVKKAHRRKHLVNTDFKKYTWILMNQLRIRCKKRNIILDLDWEHIYDQWLKQEGICYYSNLPMKKDPNCEKSKIDWFMPSLDRIDPSKGYVYNNVRWVCFGVNCFKQDLPEDQFLNIVNNINWRKE